MSALSRRAFLQAAAAGLAIPGRGRAQPLPRETLYNGITLARPWPPARQALSAIPQRAPYLAAPPEVINIDIGRQLFVDDFLIEESSLHRTFHRAEYHPKSPVLVPVGDLERRDPYAAVTGSPSPSAMTFSDGVFYDPADRIFKMWYMAGYQQRTAVAWSHDGIVWERPRLDVVRGTNIVSDQGRDSSTVWLDLEARDPSERFKMAAYSLVLKALRLRVSPDGIHWRDVGTSGTCGDRSTFFRNPFRKVWAFSLRADEPNTLNRFRRYFESRDFGSTRWNTADPVAWTRADTLDVVRPDLKTAPQIYNVDAVAYESVVLGLFTMYRGERDDREKPNDVCADFSRDGFHWSRPWREPFLAVSEHQGDWNWCNVQSAGGCCLIVGDRLHFYVSGRRGVPNTNLPGECSTGLATLRRDGFASVSDEWPAGAPRMASATPGVLTTRPLRFSGQHLFVNASIDGDMHVEVLDAAGRVIAPFSRDRSVAAKGDGTRVSVIWQAASLADLAGQIVRFRFILARTRLFAFWVSRAPDGHSRGYLAAGGPGYAQPTDGD